MGVRQKEVRVRPDVLRVLGELGRCAGYLIRINPAAARSRKRHHGTFRAL